MAPELPLEIPLRQEMRRSCRAALAKSFEVGGLRGTLGDGRLNTLFLMAGKTNASI